VSVARPIHFAHFTTSFSVWEQLQKSDLPPPEEDMVKWESEFNLMMNDQHNMDFDYDTLGMGQWEDPSSSFQPVAFDHDGIPLLGEYEFGSSIPHHMSDTPRA
jgi:peroxin-5